MTHRDDQAPHEPRDPREAAIDRRLDEVLHDLKGTYRVPPSAPPLDAMWAAIDRELDAAAPAAGGATVLPLHAPHGAAPARRHFARGRTQWFGIAAALVAGVGLGRLSERPQVVVRTVEVPVAAPAAVVAAATDKPTVKPRPTPSTDPERAAPPAGEAADRRLAGIMRGLSRDDVRAVLAADRGGEEDGSTTTGSTNRYLGQTAAMLTVLANETPRPGDDARLTRRARELLLTTRLMMDAPTTDAKTRALLEDLELVLTQVVRLQGEAGAQELRLLREALEQRDLLPRLYSAAVAGGDDD